MMSGQRETHFLYTPAMRSASDWCSFGRGDKEQQRYLNAPIVQHRSPLVFEGMPVERLGPSESLIVSMDLRVSVWNAGESLNETVLFSRWSR